MRLQYPGPHSHANEAKSRFVLLENKQRCVELYIKKTCEEFYSLIALSGCPTQSPEKVTRQGPYSSLAQGKAAMQAITQELLRLEFRIIDNDVGQWQMQAQNQANDISSRKAKNQLNFTFSPTDVLPPLF